MTPGSMIEDEPLTVGDWTPKNYENKYRGMITLRDAFAVSSNVAAVRLSERVGRDNVIRAARDLGVTSELDNQPSLALGTSGVSLMELTSGLCRGRRRQLSGAPARPAGGGGELVRSHDVAPEPLDGASGR
jgi:membrane peptidoglycan carboxypeptidase